MALTTMHPHLAVSAPIGAAPRCALGGLLPLEADPTSHDNITAFPAAGPTSTPAAA
jgi:hypothetical protein